MATMNISLPDTLREFVESQIREGGYGTTSEYLRDLIRREQHRLQLRDTLLAGLDAEVVAEADAAYFKQLRKSLKD